MRPEVESDEVEFSQSRIDELAFIEGVSSTPHPTGTKARLTVEGDLRQVYVVKKHDGRQTRLYGVCLCFRRGRNRTVEVNEARLSLYWDNGHGCALLSGEICLAPSSRQSSFLHLGKNEWLGNP